MNNEDWNILSKILEGKSVSSDLTLETLIETVKYYRRENTFLHSLLADMQEDSIAYRLGLEEGRSQSLPTLSSSSSLLATYINSLESFLNNSLAIPPEAFKGIVEIWNL